MLKVYAVLFMIVLLHNHFSSFSTDLQSALFYILTFTFSETSNAQLWDRDIHYVVFSVANYMEDLQAVLLECDICWHYAAFPTAR